MRTVLLFANVRSPNMQENFQDGQIEKKLEKTQTFILQSNQTGLL